MACSLGSLRTICGVVLHPLGESTQGDPHASPHLYRCQLSRKDPPVDRGAAEACDVDRFFDSQQLDSLFVSHISPFGETSRNLWTPQTGPVSFLIAATTDTVYYYLKDNSMGKLLLLEAREHGNKVESWRLQWAVQVLNNGLLEGGDWELEGWRKERIARLRVLLTRWADTCRVDAANSEEVQKLKKLAKDITLALELYPSRLLAVVKEQTHFGLSQMAFGDSSWGFDLIKPAPFRSPLALGSDPAEFRCAWALVDLANWGVLTRIPECKVCGRLYIPLKQKQQTCGAECSRKRWGATTPAKESKKEYQRKWYAKNISAAARAKLDQKNAEAAKLSKSTKKSRVA